MEDFFVDDSPAGVTELNYSANPEGELYAEISWKNPELNNGGTTLQSLDRVEVYKDNQLIENFEQPEIGGELSIVDSNFTENSYVQYRVVGINEYGNGYPTSFPLYIGFDSPGAVTNLTLENQSGVAVLNWENPTEGKHLGYFETSTITHYTIERNDGETFTLEGLATSYYDSSISIGGDYSYTITPHNNIGEGSFNTTELVEFSTNNTLLFEPFDTFPMEGWEIIGENWKLGESNYCGGSSSPELIFNWTPENVGEFYCITPPINSSGEDKISIKFNYMLCHYGPGYQCNIATSIDKENWNIGYELNIASTPPTEKSFEIENSDIGSENLYVAFVFSGDTYQTLGWYIDDLVISRTSNIDEETVVENSRLIQNYPNPFNPTTTISYEVLSSSEILLEVYNCNGEKVDELVNSYKSTGIHSVTFDGTGLSSGIYYYFLKSAGITDIKPMVLIK